MATPPINTRKVGTNTPAKDFNPFACADRKVPPAGSKDISLLLFSYLPLDKEHTTVWEGKNIFGMTTYKRKLQSGGIYQSYDGYRVIFEVGCQTIIYLLISPGIATHHHFLMESSEGFFYDITDRLLAAEVVRKTRGIETIAKYEMYFLLGMFSTLSLGAWLAVTGSDVLVTLATNKNKIAAFDELAEVYLSEMEKMSKYAPTLHKVLRQFIHNERDATVKQTGKNLPSHVIHDEKTQAQVSGILYGKFALSASSLNVWTALLTVLSQAFFKSVTNTPATYIETLDQRHMRIIRDLRNVNWDNTAEAHIAVQKITKIFQESKVPVTEAEVKKIKDEIKKHPVELEESIMHIYNALLKLGKAK